MISASFTYDGGHFFHRFKRKSSALESAMRAHSPKSHRSLGNVRLNRPEASRALEQAKRAIAAGAPLMRPTKARTLFEQLLGALEKAGGGKGGDSLDVSPLYTSSHGDDARAFTVDLSGEASQDAGGPYREVLNNLCDEIQSEALPILRPTPNLNQDGAEVRRDRGVGTVSRRARLRTAGTLSDRTATSGCSTRRRPGRAPPPCAACSAGCSGSASARSTRCPSSCRRTPRSGSP
jgi:hypothetical protein